MKDFLKHLRGRCEVERKISITGQDKQMLQGFRLVLEELYRDDLEPQHREYVQESLFEIAKVCVDKGYGLVLHQIKADVETEQKLVKLKAAWEGGEIEV